MKALFVHDHVFYARGEEYYSPGGLPSSAWNRYLKNVDTLYVISRGSKDGQNSSLVKSSTPNVIFDLLYNVKGGIDYYKHRKFILSKLEEYILKVDFVVIRVPSTIGYFAYQLCERFKKPYVVEVVGCAWDSTWNYGSPIVKIQAPLRYWQMRKVVRGSFAATYVTQFFLQNRYPTNAKIRIFASNVQIPSVDERVLSDHLGLIQRADPDLCYKIGIMGNLNVKYKGFDVAIKALNFIKLSNPSIKFHFYLVGGGPQNYVKSLIKESNLESECTIIGRLKAGDEVFNFLDMLDLYIHPSKQEGLPRSIIEAMNRACPVLASNVAGIPELLDEEYLHKPGDYRKLYSDIVRVFSNIELREKMAKENFKKSKDYNQFILEEKRANFFRNIVETLTV